MKAKNLMLGLVVVLSLALALPGAVLADNTTGVTGNVVAGYTFTAPAAIGLGDMTLGQENRASSTGELSGNHPSGYTVAGKDIKPTNTGYMVSGEDALFHPLMLSQDEETYASAGLETTFLTTAGPGTDQVPFYVSQLVLFDDPVATAYTITITFTVTPKS